MDNQVPMSLLLLSIQVILCLMSPGWPMPSSSITCQNTSSDSAGEQRAGVWSWITLQAIYLAAQQRWHFLKPFKHKTQQLSVCALSLSISLTILIQDFALMSHSIFYVMLAGVSKPNCVHPSPRPGGKIQLDTGRMLCKCVLPLID